MKIIDAHAHIGDFGGWAGVSNTPEEMVATMDQYEIEKTLLCPTASDTNELVVEAMMSYPERFVPLVWANPLRDGLATAAHYLGDFGFKGIKLHPLFDAFVADDTVVDPLMMLAREYDVPVFIHSGHPPFSLPWQIAFLAERHPEVKVVLIHMGHGHGVYIQAAIEMAKRYENIWLEMSGMPMPSKIREAYEKVGQDRIFFGTDLPFHAPQVEIDKVLFSGLNEKAQEKIFYHNIADFMGI